MTIQKLKQLSQKMLEEIKAAMEEDGEWTSPQGNGVNSFEAFEVAYSFNELIKKVK